MSKKICCLLIVIVCFFFSILDVDAATRKGAGYSSWDGSAGTYTNKWIGDSSFIVYCANHSYSFIRGTSATYNSVGSWDSSSSCSYDGHSGLDCSMMTGFVMHYASLYGGYVFIQKAEQTYLKLYGGSWGNGNTSYASESKGGKTISQIIKMAYNAYAEYVGASITDPGVSVALENVKDVNGKTDNGLYYQTDGAYYSYGIKVSAGLSSGSGSVDVILSTNSSKVRVCLDSSAGWDDCSQSVTIENIGSAKPVVYLITKSASSFSSSNSIELTATASYYVSSNSYTGYDTTRWCPSGYSSGVQCLLSLKTTSKKLAGKNYTDTASLYYQAVPVKSSDCSNLYSDWTSIDTTSGDTYSDSDSLVCQYNASDSHIDESESEKYTADIKICTTSKSNNYSSVTYYYKSGGKCQSASNTYTMIAIGQQGVFTFGGVEGDTHPVVKGQGFYLVSNNTYVVNLSWKKALVYSGGSKENYSYFFLSKSGSVHQNTIVYSSSDCSGSGTYFYDYVNSLVNKLSLGSDIQSTFEDGIYETYINSTELNTVPTVVEVDGDATTAIASGESLTVTYKFSTPVAYTKIIDNTITYDDSVASSDSYKEMGNRYYTMLKYSGSDDYDSYTYPFNLSISNLSVVDNVTWSITGTCNVDLSCDPDVDSSCDCDPEKETCGVLYQCDEGEGVDTCSLNYDYRSISVSNPFPKATSVDDVALNWQYAYDDSETMSRIASTFNNSIVYSVTLTGSSATSLANKYKYNSSYELFDNITKDGKSSFVTSVMSTINNSKGYCGIGVWNSDCDSWR